MQLEEFQTLATMQHLQLAKEFSFLDKWSISFDNAKRRAGACNLTNKEILVSRSHIKLNSKEIVLDTLLHEFAHAIAYELFKEVGHGTQWKRVAKQLGAIPKSTGKFKMPESP